MQRKFDQLETEGYTVFPQFLNNTTTERIREHMDSVLPPVAPSDEAKVLRINTLRHPIAGEIMAEILSQGLVELAQQTLCSNELRLLEQVLIRTDPQAQSAPVNQWHVDMAFLPEHYHARPRQTYFHMVHCLNTVAPGGGAFTIVPGSHHLTYAAAAKLGDEKRLGELKMSPIQVAGIDISQAIEVCANEGDLLVFNPMALHSSSVNTTPQPRYVYFASFYDPSATYLKNELEKTNYIPAFPDSLRDNLAPQLQHLVA